MMVDQEKKQAGLTVAGALPPRSPLQAAEAVGILNILNANASHVACFVGGCVRDTVLGRPVADIDIATLHTPKETMALLDAQNIKVVPTGIEYGTVTAVLNARRFEITTLRRDVETFGRRAVTAFSTDWREDAARRDFTMNTLLADSGGAVYDPLGQGLADLRAGYVVFVGDAETRIAEDTLRILRFFRFYGSHGKGDPDPSALAACRRFAGHIANLSRERVTQEFMKILAGDEADRIIGLMLSCDVLADIVHPEYQPAALQRLIRYQNQADAVDAIARLAPLSAFAAGHEEVLATRLLLPAAEKTVLARCLDALKNLERTEQGVKSAVYRFGNHVALQTLLMACARDGAEPLQVLIACASLWPAPVFPLTGADLKDAGFTEGPLLGRALRRTENWWLQRDFAPDRQACLEQALVNSGKY